MPRILSYLFLALVGATATAQGMKTIELEWEEVPNAESYVIKLAPSAGGDPIYFTSKAAHLSEQVPVGTYELRIRSRAKDEDVFSPWSDPVSLEVVVKELVPLSPKNDAVIEATGINQQEIEFSWSPIERVKEYGLKIWTEDPNFKPLVFTTKSTKKKLTVKTGQRYFWQVSFETSNDISYAQAPPTFNFTLIGERLMKPSDIKVTRIADDQVISWKAVDGAKVYKIKLARRFLDESGFKEASEVKTANSPWSAGKLHASAYKVEIIATAPGRTDSPAMEHEFLVKPTEREILREN